MTPMRQILTLALLCVLGGGGSGCTQPHSKTPDGPVYGGMSLTVSVPSAAYRDAWDQPVRDWGAETGATVTLVEGKADSLPAPGTACVVPLEELPDLLAKIELAEIPEQLLSDTQLAWNDLLPGLRDHLGVRMRRPVLLPLAAPVLVCGFRQDLLEKAGLQPPTTWQDYDKLVKSIGDWAPGLVAMEPRAREFRGTLLAARALASAMPTGQLGVYFDPENLSPRIASKPFVQALAELSALTPSLAAESSEMTSTGCLEALVKGQAAIALCSVMPDGGRRATDSGAALPVSFVALPGAKSVYDASTSEWITVADGGVNRPTLVGPGCVVGVVVAGPATQAEAGWALLQKLVVSEQGQLLPAQVRSPVRESQLDRVDLFCPANLGGQSSRRAIAAMASSLRGVAVCLELPIPRSRLYRGELAEKVTAVFEGTADPETALNELAKQWSDRLTEPSALNDVRRVYRETLGFVGDLSLTPLGNSGRRANP